MVNFIGAISENHKCSLCRKDPFWVARGVHTLRFFLYHDRGREAGRCASKSKRKWGGQVGASGDHIGIWLPGLSLVENMIYETSYDEHWWTTCGSNLQRKLLLPDDNSLWKVPLVEFQASGGCKGCRGSQALVEKALRRAEQVSLKTLSKLNRLFSCSYFPLFNRLKYTVYTVLNMATDRRHLILMYTSFIYNSMWHICPLPPLRLLETTPLCKSATGKAKGRPLSCDMSWRTEDLATAQQMRSKLTSLVPRYCLENRMNVLVKKTGTILHSKTPVWKAAAESMKCPWYDSTNSGWVLTSLECCFSSSSESKSKLRIASG